MSAEERIALQAASAHAYDVARDVRDHPDVYPNGGHRPVTLELQRRAAALYQQSVTAEP